MYIILEEDGCTLAIVHLDGIATVQPDSTGHELTIGMYGGESIKVYFNHAQNCTETLEDIAEGLDSAAAVFEFSDKEAVH